ncbi:hypothetical protein HPB51_011916 [Rhipicephalus microplus]|uniref:Uncharacterized protein n=1 Tax=Rhipicephalus microplus TaxID=6941 RepID=A0A9J6F216_RHIMP|nr:hypothetical protein HPB51_011916 [Rhipicephalus microplus]
MFCNNYTCLCTTNKPAQLPFRSAIVFAPEKLARFSLDISETEQCVHVSACIRGRRGGGRRSSCGDRGWPGGRPRSCSGGPMAGVRLGALLHAALLLLLLLLALASAPALGRSAAALVADHRWGPSPERE